MKKENKEFCWFLLKFIFIGISSLGFVAFYLLLSSWLIETMMEEGHRKIIFSIYISVSSFALLILSVQSISRAISSSQNNNKKSKAQKK